ncbi:hypothetical protein [Endozoicomonas arenosclerae]|uniref:hypothetical protein n=1 Tax=Endozoicomonas arenosclerae TaxID=1633495 RepID=UPI000783B8CF|nr:hypothetical protein [Endozoicomonas arenosclerae]
MKHPTKIENCLYAFLEAGPAGLRQIEVASPNQGYRFKQLPGWFWSSCLNTDVSRLGKQGIHIARAADPFTRSDGGQANFYRYWIPTRKAADQALTLLNHYRLKRGAEYLPVNQALMLVEQFPVKSEGKF